MLTMRNLERPLARKWFTGDLGSAASDLPEPADLATASTAISAGNTVRPCFVRV